MKSTALKKKEGGTICLVSLVKNKNRNDPLRTGRGVVFKRNLEILEFHAEFEILVLLQGGKICLEFLW